jgi:two-component sensor histidine kinase
MRADSFSRPPGKSRLYPQMKSLPAKARAFLLSVHLAAALAAVWAIFYRGPASSATPLEWLLFAALATLAGGKKVQVIGRQKAEESGSLTLGFAIIFAAMLRGGPHVGSLVAVLSGVSSCLYPKRQAPLQLFFNVSLVAIQSWFAGVVFVSLNGGTLALESFQSLAAAACAGMTYFAINSVGVAGIIGLCRGTSPVRLWRDTVVDTGPTYLVGTFVVTATIMLSRGDMVAVLLFGVPIAFVVYQSFAAHAALALERQQRIEDLQQNESRLAEAFKHSEARGRQQKALTHLGMLALSGMSVDEWLRNAAQTLARTLEVDLSAVLERAPDGQTATPRACFGWTEDEEACPIVRTGVYSFSGYALLMRGTVTVEDFSQETRFQAGALLESAGVVSGATAIVMDPCGDPWGVMGAYSRQVRSYTEDQVAFIQGVANLAGLVLDRDRHAKRTEQHTAEIAGLNARLQRAMAETHHRVKNNLQVITGMIDMQIMDGPQEAIPPSELQRLGQHVRALATLHDLLTQEAKADGDVHHLSTKAALERLIPLVRDLAGTRPVHYRVDDALIPVNQSTALAVLLNELVSNAVKHGEGDIDVSLAVANGTGRLEVADGGPGFPPDFSSITAASTGLELVESLSRWDLQGLASYQNRPEGGAKVVVTFPIRKEGTAEKV